MKMRFVAMALLMGLLCCPWSDAAEWGLRAGSVELKSAGPLAFGPDGILFVGDAKAATIFAVDTGDASGSPSQVKLNIAGLNTKVSKLLGAKAATIVDLAANPLSGNVYLSVSAGQSSSLVRIDAAGKLSEVGLKKVPSSKVTLPNAPEDKLTGQGRRRRNNREMSITDLAYVDGKLLVSGLSNSDSPSTVREISFPFADADQGTSIEIYHGAHGKYEDYAPIRTFIPFNIGGEPNMLAGFQCTPLVKFPVKQLSAGQKLRGTTVAELGNRNRPLDMIVYKKDGKDFLLMANSSRGVMKISTDKIDRQEGIAERISGTAGQPYETIETLVGTVQLDKLNDHDAVVLVQGESGVQDLRTVALP